MFNKVISINGAPRSGTTWLFNLFNSAKETRCKFQPLKSNSFSGAIKLGDSPEKIAATYRDIYNLTDDYLDNKLHSSKNTPVFKKDNAPSIFVYKNVRYHFLLPYLLGTMPNFKAVLIVRNPMAQLVSWKNAPQEFLSHWNFSEEWRNAQSYNQGRPEEYYGFNKWKEVNTMFLGLKAKFPDKVKIIRYEDLVNNTHGIVQELFEFGEIELGEQTTTFITESTNRKEEGDYSVYRGKKDLNEWKEHLPSEIIEEITGELKATELEQFLN